MVKQIIMNNTNHNNNNTADDDNKHNNNTSDNHHNDIDNVIKQLFNVLQLIPPNPEVCIYANDVELWSIGEGGVNGTPKLKILEALYKESSWAIYKVLFKSFFGILSFPLTS